MTHRSSSLIRVVVLTVVVCASWSPALYAQEGTRTPVPHDQTISANPFGLLLEWFNVEYERKLTNSMSIGGSASTFGFSGDRLQRYNGLFRYYPQGAALTGVFLGARVGVARAVDQHADGHAFTTGLEIGYSWLFGSKRNVGLSIGAGLDRLYGGDLEDFDMIWPNVRLVNLGIAF
jgi:hypothetical protein